MVRTLTRQVYVSQSFLNALFLTLAISFASRAHSQAISPAPLAAPAKTLAYDVASVKLHRPGDGTMFLGPTREGYEASNVMVSLLIRDAYNLTKLDQIMGLPGWASDARFDVEAKMDEETATAINKLSHDQQWRQRQLMLQAILADRFKLGVHCETKELPVYALVVAKGGSKLKPSQASEGWWSWSGPQITAQAEPLDMVAMFLSKLEDVDRVVIDKTGLVGNYDLDLKWTPDDQQGTPDAGPTIFSALQEQLGLKLVSTRAPVDVVVVDHVERPTGN